MSERIVACGNCRASITERADLQPSQRQPCTECGSLARHIAASDHAELTIHERVDIKARHEGVKKPFHESRSGDVQQADGSWKRVERVIDRDNDRYSEKVVDPESGEILHQQEEPLSRHRGHGSAKPQPPEDPPKS